MLPVWILQQSFLEQPTSPVVVDVFVVVVVKMSDGEMLMKRREAIG